MIFFFFTSYSGIISDLQNVEEIVQRIPLHPLNALWSFQSWLLSNLWMLWPPSEICGTQKGRQPVVTWPLSAQRGQWGPRRWYHTHRHCRLRYKKKGSQTWMRRWNASVRNDKFVTLSRNWSAGPEQGGLLVSKERGLRELGRIQEAPWPKATLRCPCSCGRSHFTEGRAC